MHNFKPFIFNDEAVPVGSGAKEVRALPSDGQRVSPDTGSVSIVFSIVAFYFLWLIPGWGSLLALGSLLVAVDRLLAGTPARVVYAISAVLSGLALIRSLASWALMHQLFAGF